MSSENDDTPAERLREIAESEDVWILERAPGETDEEYAERAEMLGCDAEGRIRLRRWRQAVEE
jgi:hypothetical protein